MALAHPAPPVAALSPAELHGLVARAGLELNPGQLADLVLVCVLAVSGTLMHAIPAAMLGLMAAAVLAFALLLDQAKHLVFARFELG